MRADSFLSESTGDPLRQRQFSARVLPRRSELAIRCVLNRAGESMDIQRLCPNLDRRRKACVGRFRFNASDCSIVANDLVCRIGRGHGDRYHCSALTRSRKIWPSSARRETGLRVQILSAPHFSVQIFEDVRESNEIRACPRDLRSCTDPENASGAANRQNLAKPIRARFC